MLKVFEKGSYIIFNGSAVKMAYLFLLADLIFLKNPNSVIMDSSRTLSDLYIQEWNVKANVSSKGKTISSI